MSLDHTYTSQAEIERLLSTLGVELWTDDLSTANASTFFTDIIEDVTLTIDSYVSQFYNTSDLEDSKWVRMRATYMATNELATRRGNPEIYAFRVEKILEELRTLASGSLFIGGIRIPGLPVKHDYTPAMSNLKINQWFWESKIRVQPFISTGGTYSNQHLSFFFPFYYL